jgi:hypothetical protein
METEHGSAVAPLVPKLRWLPLAAVLSCRANTAVGVDSPAAHDGGAIFGNPQERRLTVARKALLEAEMVASEKVT